MRTWVLLLQGPEEHSPQSHRGHRGKQCPFPHLTFPIRPALSHAVGVIEGERDFSEIGRLSLGSEDQSPLLSSHQRLNGSGEGKVVTMRSDLFVFAFLCDACPEPVEGRDVRPTSGPPLRPLPVPSLSRGVNAFNRFYKNCALPLDSRFSPCLRGESAIDLLPVPDS